MAIELLSAKRVEAEIKRKVKTQQMIHDGGGLYLQVAKSGSVSWIFRYRSPTTGKSHDMGLGAAHKLSLGGARKVAEEYRRLIHEERKDPITERDKASQSGRTFRRQFEFMNGLQPRPGWQDMLDIHAMPTLGDKRCADIATDDVATIISKLVATGKHETARKLQQRIQAVLKSGLGSRDTVAHKEYICHTVSKFKKVKKNKHHPSLDYQKLPAFMAELRDVPGVPARALEWIILTGCRSADAIGVRRKGWPRKTPMLWEHVDFKTRTWRVPAVKTADADDPQPFDVPLSDAALDVLHRVKAMDLHPTIVFASDRPGHDEHKSLGRFSMLNPLKRRKLGITVHGMRTTFRTWAGEETNAERDVIETALAHRIFSEDKAEGPYKSKTTFFVKRLALMQQWGEYATKVVKMKRAAA